MNVLGILNLLGELLPRLLGAGKSIREIWDLVGDALEGAGPDGQIDPEAAAKVKALLEAQLAELRKNANEARES